MADSTTQKAGQAQLVPCTNLPYSFTLTIPLAPAPCTTPQPTLAACASYMIDTHSRHHSFCQESGDICQFCAWDSDISFIGVLPPSAQRLDKRVLQALRSCRGGGTNPETVPVELCVIQACSPEGCPKV